LVADVALLAALFTVAARRPAIVALGAATVVEVGAIMAAFRWSLDGSWARSLVFISGLAAAAFLLGTNVRSRRGHVATLVERAERLERERDQQALIATAAERTRIAREMHDIVAHSLAVIISLADGAAAKLHREPDRAMVAIGNVSEIGRQALGDTRHLLGVLRSGDGTDGLSPQPGMAQIDALIAQVRATGLDASLVTAGLPRALPPGAELTVFRIVQEAITNTLKHSVAATAVAVTLDYSGDALEITVSDDGRTELRSEPDETLSRHDGHGLAGMRERVSLYRGKVSAGASAHGWVVKARLPVLPPAATTAVRSPTTVLLR
jgi:signal transduction histidine kinase